MAINGSLVRLLRRSVLCLTALLLLGACGRSNSSGSGDHATETPRDAAFDKVNREVLVPRGLDDTTVAVYGPVDPLKQGDTVRPVLQPDGSPGVSTGIDRPTWFFWVDLKPFARFQHETLFVYMDVASGTIRTEQQRWFPAVNGKDLRRVAPGSPLWVFGHPVYGAGSVKPVPTLHELLGPDPAPTVHALQTSALEADASSCCKERYAIVINGDPTDAQTARDLKSMSDFLESRGFRVVKVQPDSDDQVDLRQAKTRFFSNLNSLVGRNPALCQLVVSYHGHGSGGTMVFGSDPNGPIQVSFAGTEPNEPGGGLYGIIPKINSREIAFILDACDSGQAIETLRPLTDRNGGQFRWKKLALYAGSGNEELAYSDYIEFGGGQFTNALLEHLKKLPPTQALPLLDEGRFALPAGKKIGLRYEQTPRSQVFEAKLPSLPLVAAGDSMSCARTCGCGVRCWGKNFGGQMGLGRTRLGDILVPEEIEWLSNATQVAGGESFACALQVDGTVFCSGLNNWGQLGDGTVLNRFEPAQVIASEALDRRYLTRVSRVSANIFNACALQEERGPLCWGRGFAIDGTPTLRSQPRGIPLADVVDIAPGQVDTCAVKRDGSVFCWGSGGYVPATSHGVPGSTIPSGTPARVYMDVTATPLVPFSGAKQVIVGSGGGFGFACALRRNDKTVWCWGADRFGELGGGTPPPPAQYFSPFVTVKVLEINDAKQISGGTDHACALREDKTVWCWGQNDFAQLGDGTTFSRRAPVRVRGLTDVVEIASGLRHNCARKEDGSIWCWGANSSGQLGDGTRNQRLVPYNALPACLK